MTNAADRPDGGWSGGGPGGFPPPGGSVPRPGIIPLRPLGVGEILAAAVAGIRADPGATVGLTAAVLAVVEVVRLAAGDAAGLVDPLVSVVASAALTGMLVIVLSRAVLGLRSTVADAWRGAQPRLPGLIGLLLIIALAVGAILLAGAVPAFLLVLDSQLGGDPGGLAAGAALVAVALVLAVWLGVQLCLAAPAYVLEPIGVLAALSRSRALVRGVWWRTFGALLVVGLIAVAVAVVVAVPPALAGLVSAGSGAAGGQLVTAIVSVLVGAVVVPLGTGVSALLYLDQRIRRERFDVDLAAAAHRPL